MPLFKKHKLGQPNVDQIERSKSYYDQKYEHKYHIENYYPIFDKVLEFIKLQNHESSVLDIGCGIGECARRLKEIGFHNYFGFDLSESAIREAKKRVPEWSDKFKVHNVYELDSLKFPYDIAIAIEVLEHIQDLKFIQILKPGTILIGSVPNYWSSNNEHLRVYPNKFHIWNRFRPYMKIHQWHKHSFNKYRFIHTFVATIK